MRATYRFTVDGETRQELATAAWEHAWQLFGDDQSASDPPTLELVEMSVRPFVRLRGDRLPTSYIADVVAEGDIELDVETQPTEDD